VIVWAVILHPIRRKKERKKKNLTNCTEQSLSWEADTFSAIR